LYCTIVCIQTDVELTCSTATGKTVNRLLQRPTCVSSLRRTTNGCLSIVASLRNMSVKVSMVTYDVFSCLNNLTGRCRVKIVNELKDYKSLVWMIRKQYHPSALVKIATQFFMLWIDSATVYVPCPLPIFLHYIAEAGSSS